MAACCCQWKIAAFLISAIGPQLIQQESCNLSEEEEEEPALLHLDIELAMVNAIAACVRVGRRISFRYVPPPLQ
jgi:hypothetical protein